MASVNNIRFINMPSLVYTRNEISMVDMNELSAVTFTSLSGAAGFTLRASSNTALTDVDLSLLSSFSGNSFTVDTFSNLSGLTIANGIDALQLNFTNNALSQESIDDIFTKVDEAGYTGGTIDVGAGTNATPSQILIDSLSGKGWTIIYNE